MLRAETETAPGCLVPQRKLLVEVNEENHGKWLPKLWLLREGGWVPLFRFGVNLVILSRGWQKVTHEL